MVYTHRFSTISDLESLVCFERDVFMDLINDRVEKRNEEIRQEELRRKAMAEKGLI